MKKAVPILIKAVLVAVILAAAYYFNRTGLFEKTLSGIEALGSWSPPAFIMVYTLSCVFFIPSFVFTFAAGILFNLPSGIVLSLAGAGLGAVSALLLGRYLARPWVEARFLRRHEFRQIDRAVSKNGWRIVILARLSPIFPFLVGNYAFGLTSIPAWHYLAASMIGTIPSTTVYVYSGYVVGDLARLDLQNRARTPAEWALIMGGFLATLLLACYLKKVGQSALDESLETPAPPDEERL